MQKKALIISITAVALTLSMLAGCGNQQAVNSTTTKQQTTTEKPSTTPAPTTTAHTHSYTEAITAEATCEADGIKTFTCACGNTYTEAITKLGHDYNSVITIPTCTKAGFTTHTCSRCGSSYTDTKVAATGHTYDSGIITTEATCKADGVKTFTCACGDSYTESIAAIGHNYETTVADSAIKATCTKDGKEADTKCSNCGNVVAGTVISATGHSYGEYVYNNDATTKKDGTETAKCNICGNKTTRSKTGTKLLYDGYDEFGNGFVYGSKTEYDRMGNSVKQKIFEANNPYPLYQVIDNGDTNIYFYFVFTGSSNKGSEYNACYDAGISILFERYPEKTVQMAQGEYVGTYNGQVIYKALPITGAMGPDGRPIW